VTACQKLHFLIGRSLQFGKTQIKGHNKCSLTCYILNADNWRNTTTINCKNNYIFEGILQKNLTIPDLSTDSLKFLVQCIKFIACLLGLGSNFALDYSTASFMNCINAWLMVLQIYFDNLSKRSFSSVIKNMPPKHF
jgi:hypothetical protein